MDYSMLVIFKPFWVIYIQNVTLITKICQIFLFNTDQINIHVLVPKKWRGGVNPLPPLPPPRDKPCMYVCLCLSVYLCVYEYVCVLMYMCILVCTSVCMEVYVCVWLYLYILLHST